MNKGQKVALYSIIVLLAIFIISYMVLPFFTQDIYDPAKAGARTQDTILGTSSPELREPVVVHQATPEMVKGIYMTSCYAGSKKLRDKLVAIADTTEVNAIIIDIKDYTGALSFVPKDEALKDFVSTRCAVDDMEAFIRVLHEKNIYVIGRVTVFQDPLYAKQRTDLAVKRASDGGIWSDRKGIHYLDPGSQDVWDHVIAIAKDSYAIGFDEINFDYIRFPSDGNMNDIAFPFSGNKNKSDVLESFFSYLHEKMVEAHIPHSADLFGMTTTNYDDLNIGQVLEKTLPYFDFVMPMVYPSHYPPNFNGWKNPNTVVYDLIHFVMKRGVERAIATTTPIKTLQGERIGTSTPAVYTKPAWDRQKLRTWIQDFDYGGNYGPKEVRDQIQASNDVGLTSWIIWSPSNVYTTEALRNTE